MKRRKTISKYHVDSKGVITEKKHTLNDKVLNALAFATACEMMKDEQLLGEILNEGNEEEYDLNIDENDDVNIVDAGD